MNDNKGTPVQLMAMVLAEMTQRAIDAERQRDIEKARGDEWYNSWLRQGEELEATRGKLEKLEAYILDNEDKQKGASHEV